MKIKAFYHFQYRLGHIVQRQNAIVAVPLFDLPIAPFVHGTSESLISPKYTKIQLCSVALAWRERKA